MPTSNHTLSFEDPTWELAKTLAGRDGISISSLLSELLWYHAMVDSDRPITTKVKEMNPERRGELIGKLIESVKEGTVMKPQAFKKAVQEAAKEYADGIQSNVADSIIFDLENGGGKSS